MARGQPRLSRGGAGRCIRHPQFKERTNHGSQACQHNGLRAHSGRLNDRFFEVHALRHLKLNEVDQQNGVAHNDAGQGNHADHAGGGELGANYGRGFSTKSLRHMVRFAEAYTDEAIVSTLSRQLSWVTLLTLKQNSRTRRHHG